MKRQQLIEKTLENLKKKNMDAVYLEDPKNLNQFLVIISEQVQLSRLAVL